MFVRELDIIAIDFETTGEVCGQGNLPWQIGLAAVHNGNVVTSFRISRYLRVPSTFHFNPYTPGRWGELREQLASCNMLQDEWPMLAPYLDGCLLMAHNAPTEKKILRQSFPMHNFPFWLDTLRLAKAAYPGLKSYALGDLLDILELTPSLTRLYPDLAPHDAFYDALGCAFLFEKIINLPAWKNALLEDLTKL